jgi:hypothetical protein
MKNNDTKNLAERLFINFFLSDWDLYNVTIIKVMIVYHESTYDVLVP